MGLHGEGRALISPNESLPVLLHIHSTLFLCAAIGMYAGILLSIQAGALQRLPGWTKQEFGSCNYKQL